MRIGMFCDMYTPHLSGVTNHIRLYKRQLESLGNEVWVFTFGSRDHEDDEPNVVRSHAVPWGKTGWQAGLRVAEEARHVIPTLDVAHTHHPFTSGRVALRYAGAAGVPVVFTNHTRYDLYSDAYAWYLPRTARMAFLQRYLHDFAEQVDVVIAPSKGIASWLDEFGVTQDAVVVPNAIDSGMFATPVDTVDRDAFGFPADAVIMCYLGRLGPEKNLSLLMDAFVEAAAIDSRICLLLIGDGPDRSKATERVWAHGLSDRVHFAGRTPYERVPGLLAAADAFVTASVSEVHPLVVLEAMAAGLPVIGVRSPGVADIVSHGVTGLLAAEDSDELSLRMLDIARDPQMLRRMSESARAEACRYDIGPATQQLLHLYENLPVATPAIA
jgi:1,2-diacylglycerol 3-alpha-glucosyltransferase